jgi:hypothetical protein
MKRVSGKPVMLFTTCSELSFEACSVESGEPSKNRLMWL